MYVLLKSTKVLNDTKWYKLNLTCVAFWHVFPACGSAGLHSAGDSPECPHTPGAEWVGGHPEHQVRLRPRWPRAWGSRELPLSGFSSSAHVDGSRNPSLHQSDPSLQIIWCYSYSLSLHSSWSWVLTCRVIWHCTFAFVTRRVRNILESHLFRLPHSYTVVAHGISILQNSSMWFWKTQNYVLLISNSTEIIGL